MPDCKPISLQVQDSGDYATVLSSRFYNLRCHIAAGLMTRSLWIREYPMHCRIPQTWSRLFSSPFWYSCCLVIVSSEQASNALQRFSWLGDFGDTQSKVSIYKNNLAVSNNFISYDQINRVGDMLFQGHYITGAKV